MCIKDMSATRSKPAKKNDMKMAVKAQGTLFFLPTIWIAGATERSIGLSSGECMVLPTLGEPVGFCVSVNDSATGRRLLFFA